MFLSLVLAMGTLGGLVCSCVRPCAYSHVHMCSLVAHLGAETQWSGLTVHPLYALQLSAQLTRKWARKWSQHCLNCGCKISFACVL